MIAAHTEPCGTLAPVFVEKVELCRRWTEEVLEAVSGFDDVFDTRFEEVENRSRDGFIPFTDGGFDGIGYATMSYAHGSGTAPKVVEPYIESSLKDCEEAWNERHPEAPTSVIFEPLDHAALEEDGQLRLAGVPAPPRDHPLREEYFEFEDEWLSEGGTYFYKVRVLFHGDRHSSESGEPEAFFMVGVNTDFEYGRDNIPWLRCYGSDPQCTKWCWEKTIKVAELTDELVETFIQEASDALRQA